MEAFHQELQSLRMALLNNQMRKGQMLQLLKSLGEEQYTPFLVNKRISAKHAEQCIELYIYWDMVIAAVSDMDHLPTTAEAALREMQAWKTRHLH